MRARPFTSAFREYRTDDVIANVTRAPKAWQCIGDARFSRNAEVNRGYLVHKDVLGQYQITYRHGGSTIGLTDQSGEKLNGDGQNSSLRSQTVIGPRNRIRRLSWPQRRGNAFGDVGSSQCGTADLESVGES